MSQFPTTVHVVETFLSKSLGQFSRTRYGKKALKRRTAKAKNAQGAYRSDALESVLVDIGEDVGFWVG